MPQRRKKAVAPQSVEWELTEEEIEDELAAQEAIRRMNDPNRVMIPLEDMLTRLGL